MGGLDIENMAVFMCKSEQIFFLVWLLLAHFLNHFLEQCGQHHDGNATRYR
jgi:hypothetical protein